MGGTVGEKLGTKEIAEGAQQRAQNYYHKKIAAPADEYGTHLGRQTGVLKDKVDQEMGNLADAFGRSDLNPTNWFRQSGSKDQGAQSTVGKYSTSSQARGKSGKSGAKGSQLKTRENRKITGKGKLYVRK